MFEIRLKDICSLIEILRNQLNDLKIEVQNRERTEDDQNCEIITPLENLIKRSRQDLDSIRYILQNLKKPVENNFNNRIKIISNKYFIDRYLTSHKPREIRFRGKVYFANNWNKVFSWLAGEIISLAGFTEVNLAQDKIFYGDKRHYFSLNSKELSKPEKVGRNIWMETHLNAKQFKEVIWSLLKKADIKPGEVEIILRR